ncbi:MAG TPA: VOC family protein [Candidatus Baltobacteraceae bacterium]|nr:VOC family protein [Candidatus Baltobacteraceae bacterium]
MQQIIPFIWFDGDAEAAVNQYVSLFPNSKIERVSRYGEAGPLPAGTVMTIEFQLDGQDMMALNGGDNGVASPGAPYPGSVALFISCETQVDVDRLWDGLKEGGETLQCGWVKDRYGVVWNIVPRGLGDYVGGDDPARAKRAMEAMLKMDKLDIEALRRAYEAPV